MVRQECLEEIQRRREKENERKQGDKNDQAEQEEAKRSRNRESKERSLLFSETSLISISFLVLSWKAEVRSARKNSERPKRQ